MQIVQGSLVIIGANTSTPQVLFNGHQVAGVIGIRIDWEQDEHHVKLKVNGTDDSTYVALASAGVQIKKVGVHA
jgi:hypothetical protein